MVRRKGLQASMAQRAAARRAMVQRRRRGRRSWRSCIACARRGERRCSVERDSVEPDSVTRAWVLCAHACVSVFVNLCARACEHVRMRAMCACAYVYVRVRMPARAHARAHARAAGVHAHVHCMCVCACVRHGSGTGAPDRQHVRPTFLTFCADLSKPLKTCE